jgi:hypothetical protein
MGRPHPRHSTVYKTVRATWKNLLMYEILTNEKSVFAIWRGWLFIPSYEIISMGFWGFPNVLIQPVKFHFISRVVTKRGMRWQLVPLVLHFKEEVGVRTISSTSPSNKGHNLKKNHPIFVSGWMLRFLQREVFQIYPRGREAKIWGNTWALRFVRLQLTAKIFLAPNHTGGVHNASLTHFGLP